MKIKFIKQVHRVLWVALPLSIFVISGCGSKGVAPAAETAAAKNPQKAAAAAQQGAAASAAAAQASQADAARRAATKR